MATVVFADLVGSTGIFERLGDETAGRFVTQLTSALSTTFEQHRGRVVKLLGDGLFVVFPAEDDAVEACIAIQEWLQQNPVYAGSGNPVQIQMGVESGEVVEIDGDCYGDAVNSAARLADLAGADQILTTQRVRDALAPYFRDQLRSLGPMFLRGKSEATEVFRVDWRVDRDDDATVMGVIPLQGRQGQLARARRARPFASTRFPRRQAHAGPCHNRVDDHQRRARVARACDRGMAR